ncbi:MAG: flagellar biosynthetic protein FliR [Desulfobacteraceae bacterium]|nr:flagellar biosynthetic protein FliR [Desulfobacteraceae bacterium]
MAIFLRVTAILFAAPLFDSKTIPLILKAGLAISISLLLYPVIAGDLPPVPTDVIPFALGAMAEISVGVIIGLSVKIMFAGIQLAGQMAGYQMGFAVVNVMDPATSSQIPILAQVKNLFAMLIFLSINAHHLFLKAMVESFSLVPPFGFSLSQSIAGLMGPIMVLTAGLFVVAIKVAAPIMGVMLLSSVGLGIVARTVPQMHIFIVAMPLKIMVGFIFLGLTLPYLSQFLNTMFVKMATDLFTLLHLFK